MNKLQITTILFLTIFTACQKVNDDVEIIGKFEDQISGFQGKVTFAADGKPVAGFDAFIQVGELDDRKFNPLTGNYDIVPNPNGYIKTTKTDAQGNYKLTEVNKNLPLRYGYLFAQPVIQSKGLETYFQEYFVDGISQKDKPNLETGLEFGKIKNIDIKLHEAHSLSLRLLASNVEPEEEVRTTGKWFSPVDGKANELVSSLYIPKPAPLILPTISVENDFKSKPNTPITLIIQHFNKDKVLKSTRTVTVKMDKKENIIELL